MSPKCLLRSLSVGLVWLAAISFEASAQSDVRHQLLLKTPPAIGVTSVAVSPDESLVATAGGDEGVRIYDAKTGELLRVIDRLGDRVVAFSPDGRNLAAAGFRTRDGSTYDTAIHLRDVRTGKLVRTFDGHGEIETYAIAFSPDGKLLASAGTDKQILVWKIATGALRHRFADQQLPVSALAFSPDSATLASGGGDKAVRLWDTASGRLIRSLTGQRDWVCALAFSPDGKTIASGSSDWGFHRGHDWPMPSGRGSEQGEWRLWNAASGELLRTVTAPGRLLTLAFTPDGKSIANGIGNDVRLYDVASETPPRIVSTHDGLVSSVAFSPDGKTLYSAGHDQTVRRTRVSDSRLEWRLPGYRDQVSAVSLSKDASLLATASGDHLYARGVVKAGSPELAPGAVRLWDVRTGRLLRRLGDPAEQFLAAAVSPDGRFVAGGGQRRDGSGAVHLWDANSGTEVWSANDHAAEVLAVAVSADGALLASAAADGVVKLRDIHTGKLLSDLKGHEGGATSVVFSSDGSFFVCGAGDGRTRIWDPRTGRLLRELGSSRSTSTSDGPDRVFHCVGLSDDGRTLATGLCSVWNLVGQPVRIWNSETGALERDFASGHPEIHGRPMALSPDGSIVATGGKAIRLFDVRTGKQLRMLMGRLKRTQAITFSADGRLLVAGGNYDTTNIWEVATGRHLITLFAFPDSHDASIADEWLAATPEGFYNGSPGVDRYLSWRVDDDLQTPDTPGANLRQPEKVQSALKLPVN